MCIKQESRAQILLRYWRAAVPEWRTGQHVVGRQCQIIAEEFFGAGGRKRGGYDESTQKVARREVVKVDNPVVEAIDVIVGRANRELSRREGHGEAEIVVVSEGIV